MSYRLIAKMYDPTGAEVHPETEVFGSSPEECILHYARSQGVMVPAHAPVVSPADDPTQGPEPPQTPVTAPEATESAGGEEFND